MTFDLKQYRKVKGDFFDGTAEYECLGCGFTGSKMTVQNHCWAKCFSDHNVMQKLKEMKEEKEELYDENHYKTLCAIPHEEEEIPRPKKRRKLTNADLREEIMNHAMNDLEFADSRLGYTDHAKDGMINMVNKMKRAELKELFEEAKKTKYFEQYKEEDDDNE